MFTFLKSVVLGLVKLVKVILTTAAVAVAVMAMIHLFGLGALAGVVVTGVRGLVAEIPALLVAMKALLGSAQIVGVAAALLLGFLLLGLASVLIWAGGAIVSPVILGYQSVRPGELVETE